MTSWLSACKIPHKVKNNPLGISISGINGGEISVPIEEEGVVQNVLSKDFGLALSTFHQYTSQAGYGTPNPTSRPIAKAKQIRNDIDLSIARHSEFRKAPNLDATTMKTYEKVVKTAVYKFFTKNFKMLKLLGYEKDDLLSYAWIWTHNFHHKYRLPFGTKAQNDNFLAQHLNQRFFNALAFLKRQFDGTFLPEEDVEVLLNPVAHDDLDDYLSSLPTEAAIDKLENLIKSGTLDKSTVAVAKAKIAQLAT